MNFGSSPAAAMPLAATKGLPVPVPAISLTPPASRTFMVAAPPPTEVKK